MNKESLQYPLYIIYIWKLNPIVLELNIWDDKCLSSLDRIVYTAVPAAESYVHSATSAMKSIASTVEVIPGLVRRIWG